MAVSFKVPSSPKKSVFEIDNFLGVDLTNTGGNIDEVRSPNAENMVRYVPGKVRKRTGYKTNIAINKGTNINRALNTTDNEVIYDLVFSDPLTWVDLYEIVGGMSADTDYYYEFDYCTNGECKLLFTEEVELEDTQEEWFHASGITNGSANQTVKATATSTDCKLKIKSMSVMFGKDDSYIWNKSPEDNGGFFEKVSSDEPVYGCHILKTKEKGFDYALNENRVHGTSSEFVEYTANSDLYKTERYLAKGTSVIVDFDYESNGSFFVSFAGTSITIDDASAGHKEYAFTLTQNGQNIVLGLNSARNVKIKNFSIVLEKDDNYVWGQTYEERGIEVQDKWFYLIDTSRNYAWDESYSREGQSSSDREIELQLVQPHVRAELVDSLVRVSFDLTTTVVDLGTLTSVTLSYAPCYEDGTELTRIVLVSKNTNFNNEHLEFFINTGYPSTGKTFKNFYVNFVCTGTSTSTRVKASIINEKIEKFEFRDSYYLAKNAYLFHVGTKMYLKKDNSTVKEVCSSMNQMRSQSWQFASYDVNGDRNEYDNLYIVDGKTFWFFDGMKETFEPVYGSGKIPLLTTAKEPSGGGIPYEPLNMLQPAFEEQFYGNGSATVFQLSLQGLDDTRPIVKVRDAFDGTWVYTTNFVYDNAMGKVTFPAAPPTPPVTGEPNISITAYKTIKSYKDKVNKCRFGILFGVNGEPDRIFLSGNPDYPNMDFWSERLMPSYFGDTFYSQLGADDSAVIGYAIIDNYLAAFKDKNERAQNVIIREGDLIVRKEQYGDAEFEVSDPSFKTINSLQGSGALSPYTFGYLQTEPIFLSEAGLYAITAQDITGDKYGQNRSFYLNGKLLKENELEDSCATIYNDMYVLAVNTRLYILDGLQPIHTDKSMPYATRQYVGYYCTNVPAFTIWTQDKELWFGTLDGKICRFATDIEALDSYNDDGKPIYCCWETPDLDGRLFYKNKTFRYFAIRMMQALKTSVKLYSEKLGAWTFIKEDTSSGIVFDFENIDFELFSFSTDTSEKVVHTKMRVKKVDKARFRVENSNINEPFGLFNLALEYVESGNYKG